MKHCSYDGLRFTVINPSDVDSLPGIPNDNPPYNLRGRELRKAIWVTERCPELAYVLRKFDTESAFFARLAIDPKYVPLSEVEGGYMLDAGVMQAWWKLESLLIHVSDFLLQHAYGRPEAKFPFDPFWPSPSECGYRKTHKQAHHARQAAARSLDAFRALMARCSMSIAINLPDPEAPVPLWLHMMIKAGAEQSWIDLFRSSVVADFSPGLRVGAYLNPSLGPSGSKWIRHIPVMVMAHVPVYIVWPQEDLSAIFSEYPFLREYFPGSDPVVEIPLRAPGWQSSFIKWSSLQDGSQLPSIAPPVPDDAEIPHGLGQRPGETFENFIARREARNRQREAVETPEHRERRLARAAAAESFTRPTRATKASVFLWQTVGEHDPTVRDEWFTLDYRQQVGRHGIHDLWLMYSNNQKRYDAWANEWDICVRLAPGEERDPDDDIDIYDEIEDEYYGHSHPAGDPVDAGVPGSPAQSRSNAVTHSQPAVTLDILADSFQTDLAAYYDYDEVGYVPYAPPASSIIRQRYGVTTPHDVHSVPGADRVTCRSLQKITGYLEEDLGEGAATTVALSAFVHALLESTAAPPAPHDSIWDLAPRNPEYILRQEHAHPTMSVKKVELNGSIWYHIRYNTTLDQQTWWALIVKSGVAVLELYRQLSVQSRQDAAEYLARRAMPFHTVFSPTPRENMRPQQPIRTILGWRSLSATYSCYDYRVYEDQVRYILRGPKARAALLVGGLVWRLALEVIGETLVEDVLKGPSREVYECGQAFTPRHGTDYYDDSLSPDEIDVICGVYKVVLSKSGPDSSLLRD